MAPPITLQSIIKRTETTHKIKLNNNNLDYYYNFMSRQMEAHKEYDPNLACSTGKTNVYPYRQLLIDKVLLFSVLSRKTQIRDETDGFTFVDSEEKLRLLSARGKEYWYDNRLKSIHSRGVAGRIPETYETILNDIGKDEAITAIWGRQLDYERDIQAKTKEKIKVNNVSGNIAMLYS